MANKRVEVLLSIDIVKTIDDILVGSTYKDRSEFIREAIKEKTKSYDFLKGNNDVVKDIIVNLLKD